MKKSLALVIGNANYRDEKDKLVNAVNDSQDVARKLQTLGFDVMHETDCKKAGFENAVADFGSKLKDYEVGLFYYSGHGLQIEGINYLTCIDTNFFDETSVPDSAYPLHRVIKYMERTDASVKILILDACRDNPLKDKYRGGETLGLAPIHAPKGTIIAFSTSPGEKAQDHGMGRNSVYTGSLLRHIDDPKIPIEEVFKRVRTSVYTLSSGKQTSWEHTSLIGDYYFNSGQRIYSIEIPYKPDYVADSMFQPDDSTFGKIISGLRLKNWDEQNAAIGKITSATVRNFDTDSLFLLGRNILQAAGGGSFAARNFIEELAGRIDTFPVDKQNHVLNGMLFEVYFDHNGQFRESGLKDVFLPEILKMETRSSSKASFEFIAKLLDPFSDSLFYIPGSDAMPLAVEVKFKKLEPDQDELENEGYYSLTSLKFQERELLTPRGRGYGKIEIDYLGFKQAVAAWLGVPESKLTITSSVHPGKNDIIRIPHNPVLLKDPGAEDLDESI